LKKKKYSKPNKEDKEDLSKRSRPPIDILQCLQLKSLRVAKG